MLTDNESNEIDAFDAYMRKGEFLRRLRALELQDEAERAAQEDSCEPNSDAVVKTSAGQQIFIYETFLANQRYYDDSKHVNYKYIDYGTLGTSRPLVMEQDHRLGKGGLCWDAAFILGEYVESVLKDHPLLPNKSFIELGSGTGLAGLMVAKALNVHVTMTDLPELMPLLQRNISRNLPRMELDAKKLDEVYWEYMGGEASSSSSDYRDSRESATASVLCWGNKEQEESHGTFDVIIGADLVASLYDPYALADTVFHLCHNQSKVYISFKERQTEYHVMFETAMRKRFSKLEILLPNSRNANPEVRILVAESKKKS
jgi:predicted nicotinamide N-methyase